MASPYADQPSVDELIAFAATLLGGRNKVFTDPELLRETVTQARELWLLLYEANQGEELPDS